MGIEVGATLRDAADRLASPRGAIVVAAFALFRLADMVVYETLVGALVEFGINTFGGTVARQAGYDVADSAVTVGRVQEELFDAGYFGLSNWVGEVTSAGLDLPLWGALPLLLTLPLVAELLHVLAVRAFAADGRDSLSVGELVRGLHVVYFASLVANFFAWLVIAVGILALGLPGVVLAFVLFFVRQRVVLDGDGVFTALSKSYGTVKRNLLPVFVLFAGITSFTVLFTYVLPTVVPIPGWLMRIVSAAVVVVAIAVTTSAYLQADRELQI